MTRFRVHRYETESGPNYVVYSVDRHGVLERLLWGARSAEEVALGAIADGIAGDFDKAVWKYAYSDSCFDWRASDERLPL